MRDVSLKSSIKPIPRPKKTPVSKAKSTVTVSGANSVSKSQKTTSKISKLQKSPSTKYIIKKKKKKRSYDRVPITNTKQLNMARQYHTPKFDPLTSLYKMTGGGIESTVQKKNKVPVYMAHTKMNLSKVNNPPPTPAARAKKSLTGEHAPPSPTFGSSNALKNQTKPEGAPEKAKKKKTSGKTSTTTTTPGKKSVKEKKPARETIPKSAKAETSEKPKKTLKKNSVSKTIKSKAKPPKIIGNRRSSFVSTGNHQGTSPRYEGPYIFNRLS